MPKRSKIDGQIVEMAPDITEEMLDKGPSEEDLEEIEEIEEMYAAAKMIPEEMAETLHLPLGYVLYHYDDDDLDWIEEYDPDDWIEAKTGKFIWDLTEDDLKVK